MKKIGLITIHNAYNYGATYQAYGLLHFLNSLENIQAEFIDYTMNSKNKVNIEKKYSKYLKVFYKIRHIGYWIDTKERTSKFQKFWKRYYILSKRKYKSDIDLINNFPKYDIYFSGSDQIFNLDLTNHSIGYFLPCNGIRKISYSSSFGMNGLNIKYLKEIKKYLSDYEAISIREKSALHILEEQANINACVTVDPVFLLNKNEWELLSNPIKVPKEYIFCYIMSESPGLKALINYLKNIKKLPILIVKTYHQHCSIDGKQYNNLGPDEILFLLSHAKYVVSNSFHGCALSIIFEKKFFCLQEEKWPNDKRYEAMMYYGKIINKIIPINVNKDFKFSEYLIDGYQAYNQMANWIKKSKDFLIKHVQ